MDHIQNLLSQVSHGGPSNVPPSSQPAESIVHKIDPPGRSQCLPSFHTYFIKMTQLSSRYMAWAFCNDYLPPPPPPDFPFAFSPVPPLEDYIRRLLEALPQNHLVMVSMQTILFLDRIHRVFLRARTVNPHGLYLAALMCAVATRNLEGAIKETLVRADSLFSRGLVDEMMGEFGRLLGGYSHRLNVPELGIMWRALCLDDAENPGAPVDAASGDWSGGVAVVPTWSRLLCDMDQLHGLGAWTTTILSSAI